MDDDDLRHHGDKEQFGGKTGSIKCNVLDEASENAMLRSRIDEQGQLICYLKQRADEHLCQVKALRYKNNELDLLHTKISEEKQQIMQKCEMLEMRFNELAENHEQMIQIKDDYKVHCQQLSMENQMLKDANKKNFSEEQESQIMCLKSTLQKSEETIEKVRVQNRHLQNEILQCERLNSSEIKNLGNKLDDLNRALKTSNCETHKLKTERDKLLNEKESLFDVKNENKRLNQEVNEQRNLLKLNLSEVEKLKNEIVQSEEKLKMTVDDFARREDCVNANLKVKRLQRDKDAAEAELSKLKVEFEAFRRYSDQLLSQEKDLNCKLRNTFAVD